MEQWTAEELDRRADRIDALQRERDEALALLKKYRDFTDEFDSEYDALLARLDRSGR